MTKKPPPATQRDEATLKRRRHIVESAAACFIEQGFHQTSVRDISAKAGISLGNLYNHFDSKAALIAEIATLETEDLARIETILEETRPAYDRTKKFAGSYFDTLCQPETAILSAEITAEAMRNPRIAKGFVDNRDRLATLLADTLQQGKQMGDFQFDCTSMQMAHLLLDIIEAAATRVAFDTGNAASNTRKAVETMIMKSIGT